MTTVGMLGVPGTERRRRAARVLYKDHNNRIPPIISRTYQILPHTNSYFHRLYSYLGFLQ